MTKTDVIELRRERDSLVKHNARLLVEMHNRLSEIRALKSAVADLQALVTGLCHPDRPMPQATLTQH